MNRVRICGEIINQYERVIVVSDEELQQLRSNLNHVKNKGDQSIDDFLGESYGDQPFDWQCIEWSAELINDKGLVIESLDT
jgi:hypothetical protein